MVKAIEGPFAGVTNCLSIPTRAVSKLRKLRKRKCVEQMRIAVRQRRARSYGDHTVKGKGNPSKVKRSKRCPR